MPGRNLLFLTFAAALAYRRGLKRLVAGMCETDYSGYPDCRDDTIKALQVALNLGMDARFVIETPLMWIDKAATWRLRATSAARRWWRSCARRPTPATTATAAAVTNGDGAAAACPACALRAAGYAKFRAEEADSPPR